MVTMMTTRPRRKTMNGRMALAMTQGTEPTTSRVYMLAHISDVNRARCARWHNDGIPWMCTDWSNALAGETGELCNVVKKLRRIETGVSTAYNTPDNATLLAKLRDEIADVFLYLDLVANHFGYGLEECIIPKFNQVSEAQGYPERL